MIFISSYLRLILDKTKCSNPLFFLLKKIVLHQRYYISVVTFSREKVQCEIMLALLMFQTVKMFHGIFSFITTENSLQARGKLISLKTTF